MFIRNQTPPRTHARTRTRSSIFQDGRQVRDRHSNSLMRGSTLMNAVQNRAGRPFAIRFLLSWFYTNRPVCPERDVNIGSGHYTQTQQTNSIKLPALVISLQNVILSNQHAQSDQPAHLTPGWVSGRIAHASKVGIRTNPFFENISCALEFKSWIVWT